MKAVSGKFHPLFQWFYFDSVESLPPVEALTPEACAPQVQPSPLDTCRAERCWRRR